MKHEYTVTVPSYLCRSDDLVHIDGLAALLQEAAWQHARRLGVAFTEHDVSQYWILHRLGFRIARRPEWSEEILVETWPSRMIRLYAMREFRITDRTGAVLVEASSAWIILDSTTRRPLRPEKHLSRDWVVDDVPFEMPTGKLEAIDEVSVRERLRHATWHLVRPSDTDRNDHVNNSRYAQWVLDALPLDGTPTDEHEIRTLSFVSETVAGQEYTVVASDGLVEVWVRKPGEAHTDAICACRFNTIQS